MVEGRHFIFTDYKALTYALVQNPTRSSPWQVRHFKYISQFTTDMQFIKGVDNIVANTLSRVDSMNPAINCEKLAKAQTDDAELAQLLKERTTELQLTIVNIPETTTSLYCDVSQGTQRSFVTTCFRRQVFKSLHDLAHPGTKATTKLTRRCLARHTKRLRQTKTCIQCQRAKITRHNKPALGSFNMLTQRFQHIHLDLMGRQKAVGTILP